MLLAGALGHAAAIAALVAARAREGGRPTLRLTGLGMVLLVGAVVGTTSVAGTPVTPEQQTAADGLVADTRASTNALQTVQAAEAAGYELNSTDRSPVRHYGTSTACGIPRCSTRRSPSP